MNNSSFGKKTLALSLALVALFSVVLFTPPQTSRADPIIFGGILAGVLGIDFFSCNFNLLFFCDSSSGGNVVGADNGSGQGVQAPCTSSPNSCGNTSLGFYGSDGVTCSATPPADSSCAAPNIPAGTGFFASPSSVQAGETTTLTWNTTNSTSCTVTGGGLNQTGGPSGTIQTAAIQQPTDFTLTCNNGTVSQASFTFRVKLIPQYKEL